MAVPKEVHEEAWQKIAKGKVHMILTPHGFCLLTHENEGRSKGLYRALLDAGFGPWDRNGLPLLVVLASYGSKQQWFEAGILAGQRVPLFLVGDGARFRKRHIETIGRLGGWAASIEAQDDLGGQIVRRGIKPSAWDVEASRLALARILTDQPNNTDT
jgi:hypothetical protein